MGKLTDAVTRNDLQEVQRLLAEDYRKKIFMSQHHLINEETNKDGEHPLHIAAGSESTQIIELLLKAGANVDQKTMNNGRAPLHIAAQKGQMRTLQALLNGGAKINQPDKDGRTSLYIAASEGHVKAVQVLLKGGADVNQAYPAPKEEYPDWISNKKYTPLYIAICNGHAEVVQALLNAGARVDNIGEERFGNHYNDFSDTALWHAVNKNKGKVLQVLLSAGANVDQVDYRGGTILHIAVVSTARYRYENKEQFMQVLLKSNIGAKMINQPDKYGCTPLHMAISEMNDGSSYSGGSNYETIQALLDAGAKVDQLTESGRTPLYIAVEKGQVATMKALLKAGADVNQSGKDGNMPLYVAAQQGKTRILRYLTNAGASVNQSGKDGYTPLYIAVCGSHVDIVQILLNARAQIDPPDNFGRTPLYIAAQNGNYVSVRILLYAGANANIKTKEGKTPLNIAKEKGHISVVRLFEEYIKQQQTKPLRRLTVSVTNQLPISSQVYPTLSYNSQHYNQSSSPIAQQSFNYTQQPLVRLGYNTRWLARNEVKTIPALLKEGIAFNLDGVSGCSGSTFYVAASEGCKEAVQALLEIGVKVDDSRGSQGYTPLSIAVRNGHTEVVQILLNAGAKVDQFLNDFNETPLYIASTEGYFEIVQALLNAGAKINQAIEGGYSPLHGAASKGDAKVVQFLLDAGAQVGQPTHQGITPLFMAAQRGYFEIMRALLNADAQIDQPNDFDWTPLHIAAQEGKVDAIHVLLNAGANVNVKTKDGKIPLDIAREKGHVAIVKLLEDYIKRQKIVSPSQLNLVVSQSPISEIKKEELKASPKSILNNTVFSFTLNYSELGFEKELGKGGFGVVYLGAYRHNPVAIKQLHLTKPSKEALEEFQHEMEIMNRLRCPQIVSLYGVYREPSYGIVMEYMPNGSLYNVLHSNKPLDWSVRYSIAMDMAKGVAFLHKENILHRDLKSLNVLLDEHMKAKLTDFGLAKVKNETVSVSSNNNNTPMKGSLLWMAPELFKRGAECTPKSDMYSLGMTIWELASRKRPFEDATNAEIALQWIKDGELDKIPTDCPLAVSKLITLCWDRETTKRPTADETVKRLLDAKNDFEGVASKGTRPLLL